MASLKSYAILVLFVVSVTGQGSPQSQCPEVVGRPSWNALPPKSVNHMTFPVPYAIIIHTDTPECTTNEQCQLRVRSIQSYQMSERNFDDIAFSFLIGGDGKVYEGVGWHKVGSHSRGYNTRSLGIALIGNFDEKVPSESMTTALRNLLQCAVSLNELTSDYKLLGHRQVTSVLSPGRTFYEELKTWPHWASEP
ncbi:peptidoglycan recognition protein-like [Hetaerina americana]|uniref:peptidoglycan recognition protein-like n=1 Tax=Hetaerina americana TaxID=62018 RepID=UPI003A7F539A